MGLVGNIYLVAALVSGLIFVGASFWIHAHRMEGAKKFVTLSIAYLIWLIGALLMDRKLGL